MDRCNRAGHREHNEQCGNSAEQPDDQSDSTEQFSSDHKKSQSRREVQMFGEGSHAAGKTGPAIPSQHFLSAVGKEYDSQHDASDRHDPVSVSTCQAPDHQSSSLTGIFPAAVISEYH
jgi:hypothetical protein